MGVCVKGALEWFHGTERDTKKEAKQNVARKAIRRIPLDDLPIPKPRLPTTGHPSKKKRCHNAILGLLRDGERRRGTQHGYPAWGG